MIPGSDSTTIRFNDADLSTSLSAETRATAKGIVEYSDVGDGPVVVALHGAMGGWDQSLILAQTIGDTGFRYLAVTRPGYLGTPIQSGKSAARQADLIAALLDTLGVPKAGVMAISGGGPAAVEFGLRHSARCAGLVLVSTCAGKLDTPIPFYFKIMTFFARWSWFSEKLRKKTENNLQAAARHSVRDPQILARTIADAEAWPLFRALMLSPFDRMAQRLKGTQNDIEITRSTVYLLEQLSMPVLVVHGTEDPLVPFKANAEAFQQRIPDAELLAIEGGEHVVIFTHRRLIRPRVAAFMQQHFR